MLNNTQSITESALKLPPIERAALIEQMIASLDTADPHMDSLWAKEAESRLNAYHNGAIQAVPLTDVLAKYLK